MKSFLTFLCLVALICMAGGCQLLDELRNPKKKQPKTVRKPLPAEPEVLPDGTTYGLNPYEKEYIKDINQDFKRRQQLNSRKVFGGFTP